MELGLLVGKELRECHFGKMWARLVFADPHNSLERLYDVETQNLVSALPLQRYGNADHAGEAICAAVWPRLEQIVETIERIPNGIQIRFAGGGSIFVCYDGESSDSLLLLRERSSGEWAALP